MMNYFMEICSRTQIHVQFTNYKVQFQKKSVTLLNTNAL